MNNVPVGYKLVPIEPTPEMKNRGISVPCGGDDGDFCLTWEEVTEIYKEMIKAVP